MAEKGALVKPGLAGMQLASKVKLGKERKRTMGASVVAGWDEETRLMDMEVVVKEGHTAKGVAERARVAVAVGVGEAEGTADDELEVPDGEKVAEEQGMGGDLVHCGGGDLCGGGVCG